MKRTFTQDELEDIEFPYAYDRTLVGTTRWELLYHVIFPFDGAFWKVEWKEGATEMQDYNHWDFYDTIDGVQVERRPVTREEWVEVEE